MASLSLLVITGFPYSGKDVLLEGVRSQLPDDKVQYAQVLRVGTDEGAISQSEFDTLAENDGLAAKWLEDDVNIGVPVAALTLPDDGKVVRIVPIAAEALSDFQAKVNVAATAASLAASTDPTESAEPEIENPTDEVAETKEGEVAVTAEQGEGEVGVKETVKPGTIKCTVFSVSDDNPDTYLARARVKNENVNEADVANQIAACHEVLNAPDIIKINNSTTIKEGTDLLLRAIIEIEENLLAINEDGSVNLQTCPAKQYLAQAIYPLLSEVMERINIERPSDPIESLGMYLYQEATKRETRRKELVELKSVQEELRDKLDYEFNSGGRV